MDSSAIPDESSGKPTVFDQYTDTMIRAMREITGWADEAMAAALFGLGAVLVIAGLFFRITSRLESMDFIAILLVAGLLVLVATGFRFMAYRMQWEFARSQAGIAGAIWQQGISAMTEIVKEVPKQERPSARFP